MLQSNVLFNIHLIFILIFIVIIKELDPVVLFESVLCGFWALTLVMFACEAGQRTSNEADEIDDAFSQIDWYLLPVEVQRILPIMIIYMKEPIAVEFFGTLSCSREQFKKVSQIQ